MRPLDRVIGYKEIKEDLYHLIDVMNNPKKYQKLGVERVKGIILEGKPGIGKTLMAKCFMDETSYKQYIVRKDKPDGEFVIYINEIFEEARNNAPAIILLDDVDKFANEDRFHRNAEEYVTIQSCIDNVKDEQVFVIATANDIDSLPDSLRRVGRFDKEFYMDFPRNEDAREIIKYYLKNKKTAKDIDIDEVVHLLDGGSCSALENVMNEAAIIAGYQNKDCITQSDLREACLHIYYGNAKDYEAMTDAQKRAIAVHEAGHVVIAELMNPGRVVFSSASTGEERTPGITVCNRYNGIPSFEEIETKIHIALAGRAASEVVLGNIDMGGNKDMHHAFDLTRRLLDDNTSFGFDCWCHGKETSQQIYDKLDAATGLTVSRYYMQTKQMLIKNRSFLDAMVEALMNNKTLFSDDIAKIKEFHEVK